MIDQQNAEAQQRSDHTSSTPTPPQSQRERLCLQALAQAEAGIFRKDLDKAVCTVNSPEYINRLRAAGWQIITERVPFIDRYGSVCSSGRYHLHPSERAAARQVLRGN